MVCPNCGRRTFKNESTCPKCGAPMSKSRSAARMESDAENRFKKAAAATLDSDSEPPKPENPAQPEYAPNEQPKAPSEEIPASVFVPEIEFKPVNKPIANPSDDGDLHSEGNENMGFYGSYGEICSDSQDEKPSVADDEEFKPVFSYERAAENEWELKENISEKTEPSGENIEFDDDNLAVDSFDVPMNNADSDEDDELILPDLSEQFARAEAENVGKDKSLVYEDTVELKNARKAYKNETPKEQSFSSTEDRGKRPKVKDDIKAVASGTMRVNGKPLKDGKICVEITPKQLRQLRGRRFRGLGIVCTLCLVIISSFCIWSYASSFADPIVGCWKGDVKASDIPITYFQALEQDILNSTWEFSNNGSLYLNITVNGTPINLSGSYTQQNDENDRQYLSMTITNPMDGTDYTMSMYYTVTGDILEFNDMEGLGIAIDLVKE